MNYKPRTRFNQVFHGPSTSDKDPGALAEVEIETGEAVVAKKPENVTIFGGAKAKDISSRGFMVDGARHGQKNTAGTSGIPLASKESVYIASDKINAKGWDDKKNSQAKEAKKYLKYFKKADENPQDKYLNNPQALAMLDNEMQHMEQTHNEGRFMKGLHDLTKKKNRSYEDIMKFIMQEAPNEGAAMAGQEPQGMTPGMNTGAQNEPLQPQQPQGPEQPMPMAQFGGTFGGALGNSSQPTMDPSLMTNEQRHKFNMEYNIMQHGGQTFDNNRDARFHNKMQKRFGSDAYGSYMNNHAYSGAMNQGDRRNMRKNLKHGPKNVTNNYYGSSPTQFGYNMGTSMNNSMKSNAMQPQQSFTHSDPSQQNNQPNMFAEYAYGGRNSYQQGGRMQEAMQQHRKEEMGLPQGLQQGPNVQTQSVNPSSVNPTSQYQGFGVNATQKKEALPWQLDSLVKKHSNPTVSKGTPQQDLRTMANLADKGGKSPSGLSNFLPKRMTELYGEDFKGWDNVGDGANGVLTDAGKKKALAAGMTEEQISTTDWTNFDKSDLYKKVYADNISDKTKAYHQNKTYGTSASTLGDRSKNYNNVGELAFEDLKSLRKGESFNQEGANTGYRRAMNDAIHDGIVDPSLSDKENAARLNSYLKNSQYGRNVNQHFDKKTKSGSDPKEIARKETLGLGHTDQTADVDPTKVDMAKGTDGQRISFKQAFRDAKKKGLPTFTWNGRSYLGKTESETTKEEKTALKKGASSYNKPSGEIEERGGFDNRLTGNTGSGSNPSALQSTGSQTTAPTPGQQTTNNASFDVRNQGSYLRRSSRRNGGYVQPTISNGQRVSFQKGGRVYNGTVANYDPMTGDFDLM